MKTLIFEGVGGTVCNDVENCRIRTAFTNNSNQKIYLELSATIRFFQDERGIYYRDENGKTIHKEFININSCFEITDNPDIDDENFSKLPLAKKFLIKVKGKYGEIRTNIDIDNMLVFTKHNILKLVNSELDCDFDEIKIINYDDNKNDFYRVHSNSNKYNTSEQYYFMEDYKVIQYV